MNMSNMSTTSGFSKPPGRISEPFCVIGGPAHGMVVNYRFDHIVVPMAVPNQEFFRNEVPKMNQLEIFSAEYDLQRFAISLPNLELTGYAYVWRRLDPSSVVAAVLGHLLAKAMLTSAEQIQTKEAT